MNIGVNVFKSLAPIFIFLLFSPTSFSLSSIQQSYQVELLEKAEKLKLWEEDYWIKLFYYEKSFFLNGYKSQNINPDFFLSKYGRYSPRSEMINHIIELFYEGEDDNSPECKFPLRYKWLRKKLDVDEKIVSLKNCKQFNEWRSILNPNSISIIFTNGYLSNPSTLYGHTFLVLRNPANSNSLLLDYTVNYAATTSDDSGIGYAIKGLLGKYPGNFNTMPYYLKIQEYQNMENRDLWEYPLNLTKEEIENFLMHSWELGKTAFPYYFFSRNCSWQLLPLFEIVRPGIRLKDKFMFWNIPSDTLKVIVDEFGDKKKFIYRPSAYSKLKSKITELDENEQKLAIEISKGGNKLSLIENLNYDKKIRIMDTAADYISFRHYNGEITQAQMDKMMDPILVKMSMIDNKGYVFKPKTIIPFSPVNSRNSFMISSGVGKKNGKQFYELRLRTSLCELVDFNEGYLDNSELVMGDLKLRYIKDYNKFYLKEIIVVNVLSLNPVDRWFKKTSWGVKFGYYEYERNKKGENDGMFHLETSRGFSFERYFNKLKSLFFIMAQLDIDYAAPIKNNFRYGLGPSLGILIGIDNIKLIPKASYIGFKNDKGELRKSLDVSYHFNNDLSSVLKYSKNGCKEEYSFNLNFFFFP